jgi:WD40 repeat protein
MQEIYSLDFSRDGRFLVSGSGDKSARVWDIEKGTCVFDLRIEDFLHNEHGPIDAGITSVARKSFYTTRKSWDLLSWTMGRRWQDGREKGEGRRKKLMNSITWWKTRCCWIIGYNGQSMERYHRTTIREVEGSQR